MNGGVILAQTFVKNIVATYIEWFAIASMEKPRGTGITGISQVEQ